MTVSLSSRTFAIIGAGNMGTALMKGLISGGARPDRIRITNKRATRSRALARQHAVVAAERLDEAVDGADIVILAVKPQVMPEVLTELSTMNAEALYISIAAGITCASLQESLPDCARVIRAMPTPALIGEGATAIAAGDLATPDDLELCRSIFSRVGITVTVPENLIDAVTGLSGSGPAYVMVFIEALSDAGVRVGLPRDVSMQLALQTVRGSAQLLHETEEHPARLKDQVTSPGGTTIAGLHALEAGGMRGTVIDAVRAACERAHELGKQ